MPNFFNKYPYTDFHELNLDWILETIKNVVAEWADTLTAWGETQQAWHDEQEAFQNLHDYVMNYFDNLDVQEEINNKLNQMAADGTLDQIILPYFNQYKTEINSIINNQNNRLNILEARMDSFVHLAEGSTTGDAELIDARIGADGITYNTAGDAIRGQIEEVFAGYIGSFSDFSTYTNAVAAPVNYDIRLADYSHPIDGVLGKIKIKTNGNGNTYLCVGTLAGTSFTVTAVIPITLKTGVNIYQNGIDFYYPDVIPANSKIGFIDTSRLRTYFEPGTTTGYTVTINDIPEINDVLTMTASTSIGVELIFYSLEQMAGLQESLTEIKYQLMNEIVPNSITSGKAWNTNTSALANVSGASASLYSINADTEYYVTSAFTASYDYYPIVNYFDAGMNYISSEMNAAGPITIDHFKLTVPISAEYVYINARNVTPKLEALFKSINSFEDDMIANSRLYGKIINVIGDSYVAGNALGPTSTWHYMMADRYNMIYNNYGINGNPLIADNATYGRGTPVCERYQNMPAADYVVVIAGKNDYNVQIPIEDFKEGLHIFCQGLVNMYVNNKICFFTPWNVPQEVLDSVGNPGAIHLRDYIDAIVEVCNYYSIPVYDCKKSGVYMFDAVFRSTYCQSNNDISHLNAAGSQIFLPKAESFMLSL